MTALRFQAGGGGGETSEEIGLPSGRQRRWQGGSWFRQWQNDRSVTEHLDGPFRGNPGQGEDLAGDSKETMAS